MTLRLGRIGRAASIAVALLGVFSMPGRAQAPDATFIVAVPELYPAQEGFGFIVRSGDPRQKDVIIMNRETLDARALVAAVALLRELRGRAAVPDGALEVTTVQGFAPRRGRQPRAIPALDRALASLRAAPLVRIGNVGTGRWLELQANVMQ